MVHMFCRWMGVIVCLVILLATPLEREVFAVGSPEVDAAASSTSEDVILEESVDATTTVAVEEPVVIDESWYRSDMLSGKIQVGDFVVGPGSVEIEVEPGETVVQEVSVANRISDNRTFMLEVEDIEGSPDGSSDISLTGARRGPYSIRDFVSFPKDELELALGERARIPVTITIPPNTSPGGYYGSILVSTVQKTNVKSGEQVVPTSPIIARVGSLFFIRVKGDVAYDAKVQEIDTLNSQRFYQSGPIELQILTENLGSVHVRPYGELLVTNMFGQTVGEVDLEPWYVLPKSQRLREVTWTREFLVGRYTVTANIERGYDDIVDVVTVSFWVLPWKIMLGIFVGLFVVIFSIRAFFKTFEFKRK